MVIWQMAVKIFFSGGVEQMDQLTDIFITVPGASQAKKKKKMNLIHVKHDKM